MGTAQQPEPQPRSLDQSDRTVAERQLLERIVEETYRPRDETQRKDARADIAELVKLRLRNFKFGSKSVERDLQARVAAIDELLSKQVAAILHHEKFSKLEGTWRGLHYLTRKTRTNEMLRVRAINASKKELFDDLDPERRKSDKTHLFKTVYENEFGQFGGQPFSALVGDYEWTHDDYEDVETLKVIAKVAAAAHAPFVSAASPRLLGLRDDMTEIADVPDIADVFTRKEYVAWNSFRDMPDSRYVGLTLPRFMARQPYGPGGRKAELFTFDEGVNGRTHKDYVWSNAAYAFAARLTSAFDQHGWTTAIRGVENGGLVEALPTHMFETDAGGKAMKCPTEVPIGDRSEATLSRLGFIPLVHCKDTADAAFFGAQSVHRMQKWDTHEANANERLSAQLPYLFAVSRFAHFLKSMVRDWVGGTYEQKALQEKLNRWIGNYVLADDMGGPETKAKYPLRMARIDVAPIEGQSGHYQAIAYLRPHFQLEEIDVSLRLVAELPEPKKPT